MDDSFESRTVPLISVYQADDEIGGAVAEPVLLKAGEARPGQERWRDLPWAAAFLLHACAVLTLALSSGANFGSGARYAPSAHKAAVLVGGVALLLLVAAALAVLWLRLLIRHAADLIELVLWGTAGGCALVAVVYFTLVSGGWFMGLVFGLAACAAFFFAVGAQDRVPFASATLRVACQGLQAHMPGLLLVGMGAMLAVAAWVLLWSAAYLGSVGATAAARGFWRGCVGEPLLLLSLCWGCQVGVGVAHLATAGAVADWWFHGDRRLAPVLGASSDPARAIDAGSGAGAGGANVAVDDGEVGGFRSGLSGGGEAAERPAATNNTFYPLDVAVDLDLSLTGGYTRPGHPTWREAGPGGDGHRPSNEAHYCRDALNEVLSDFGLGGLGCTDESENSDHLDGRRASRVLRLGPVVGGSLGRACTTSFGSACCGALVVAVLHAAKAILHDAEQRLRWHYYHGSVGLALGAPQPNGGARSHHGGRGRFRYGSRSGGRSGGAGSVAATHPRLDRCVAGLLGGLGWCVGRLEAMAEYFNKFAFVHCAVYGDDFPTAGAKAAGLFRSRGWSAIVNDSLIDAALTMGGLLSGALVGVLGWGLGTSSGVGTDAALLLCGVGLLSGYGLCALLLHGLVTSSVATVFVCFAQAPHALATHHPALHRDLVAAWQLAHPEALAGQHGDFCDGGGGGGDGGDDARSGPPSGGPPPAHGAYLQTQAVIAKGTAAAAFAAAPPLAAAATPAVASARLAADAAGATMRAASAAGDRSGAAAARAAVAARNADAAEALLAPQRVPLDRARRLGASVTFAAVPERPAVRHGAGGLLSAGGGNEDGAATRGGGSGLVVLPAASGLDSLGSGRASAHAQQVQARASAMASSLYGSLYGSTYGSIYGSVYGSANGADSGSDGGGGAFGFASVSLGTSSAALGVEGGASGSAVAAAGAWGWGAKLDLHGLFLAEAEVKL
jgi:hypothetical protein